MAANTAATNAKKTARLTDSPATAATYDIFAPAADLSVAKHTCRCHSVLYIVIFRLKIDDVSQLPYYILGLIVLRLA